MVGTIAAARTALSEEELFASKRSNARRDPAAGTFPSTREEAPPTIGRILAHAVAGYENRARLAANFLAVVRLARAYLKVIRPYTGTVTRRQRVTLLFEAS